MSEIKLVEMKSEKESYSDDDLYNISSWGVDMTFRELIAMYEEGDLLKPELQRKYVWNKNEASRFIDSILLGLPIPSIFLAKEKNGVQLIVDGYQRIMTVYDYVKGIFSQDNKVFKLSNQDNINPRWRNKAFMELTVEEQRRIRTTAIHAIIFEQKYPNNDTGMFQVFERINTGGRTLKPQEIRNCVYQGSFNSLLFELNQDKMWRNLIAKEEDARMADLELILRFFALKDLYSNNPDSTQINLVKYLNKYMGQVKDSSELEILDFKRVFTDAVCLLSNDIGKDVFRNLKKDSKKFTTKISPAIYDAVMIATALSLKENNNVHTSIEKYVELLENQEFIESTTQRTTNVENINKRINKAKTILFG